VWRFGLYLTGSGKVPIVWAFEYCKKMFSSGGKKEILCQSVGLLVTNLNKHRIFYILVPYKRQKIKLHHTNVPFFHVTVNIYFRRI